jgi:hypothetical protein
MVRSVTLWLPFTRRLSFLHLAAMPNGFITRMTVTRSRDLMQGSGAHFQRIAPTLLLLELDWAFRQAAPFMSSCSDGRGRSREMDCRFEAHRQGQLRLVQIRLVPAGRRISVDRQGLGGYAGCGQALCSRPYCKR